MTFFFGTAFSVLMIWQLRGIAFGSVGCGSPNSDSLEVSDGETINFRFPDDSTDSATWSLEGSTLRLVGGRATATIAALPVGSVVEAFVPSAET